MSVILTWIVFLPLLFGLAMWLVRVRFEWLRIGALLSGLLVLGLTLLVAASFDPYAGGMQFVRHLPWIESYGISYYLGVDALNLVLLLLTSLLIPLLHLYMWNYREKGYWYNLLLLQSGVTGAILSLDLILFYLFWETMLLPIFIMIGRYGHGMQHFNAMKILLMTVLGSMAMLFSILYLGYEYYSLHGVWSFAYDRLAGMEHATGAALWLTAGFLLAFAIKIPLPGFHTWMAPAYASAPTPALVILSAIMAKLGAYGLWRFGYGLFPRTLAEYTPWLLALGIGGMVYFALRAVMEQDLRRMFAFSSGSHLSLIAAAVVMANLYAWSGALYLIAAHALASSGIFLMIGMLYRRSGSVRIADLGGIASRAPRFAFLFTLFALGIAGVPGTGGFVGELLIILGGFTYTPALGFATALTMLAAILFVFWMLQRVLFGTPADPGGSFRDLSLRELGLLLPLAGLLILTGVAPSLFTPLFEPQLQQMLAHLAATLSGGV